MARVRSTGADRARFVFKGTVQRLGDTTDPSIEVTSRTAVVRVDEVVRAPQVLSTYAGHDITVDLAGAQTLTVGQQALFYATGWICGESLAVQAAEHLPVETARVATAIAQVASDPVTNLAELDARTRFDAADVVVSGRVVSISLPTGAAAPPTARAVAAAVAEGSSGERFSEHVPIWRDAVIEVQAVHKGRHPSKRAVVRFPASTDVMWHRAPKFQAGNEGFFLLHRGELKRGAGGRRALAMAAIETEDTFTALDQADFQPFDHPGGVRTLVAATADAGATSAPSPARRRTRRSRRTR